MTARRRFFDEQRLQAEVEVHPGRIPTQSQSTLTVIVCQPVAPSGAGGASV
jgi:hypothetical protein